MLVAFIEDFDYPIKYCQSPQISALNITEKRGYSKPSIKGTEIGIIGFGQFGQFAAKLLRKRASVVVSDAKNLCGAAESLGVRFVPLQEAASRNIVILAVPISAMEQVLRNIKPFLRKGTLLADVCSVKMQPVELMKKIVPSHINILGTHPLFGPQSGRWDIKGKKIVLCPARVSRWQVEQITKLLKQEGLNVLVMSAEEHDIEIAKTQAMTHFIAKVLDKMGTKSNVSTMSSELIQQAVDLVKDDSLQLFLDMQKQNPFAAEWRHEFIQQLISIDKELGGTK